MEKTLYELTEEYKQIQAMVEDDGEDEQTLIDTLDSIDWTKDFEEKADSYVMVIRNAEVDIAADEGRIKAVEKILENMKKSKTAKENHVKRMKESLHSAMVTVGKPKFKTKMFSFWTQTNTPSVVIDKPEAIPMDYYRVPEPEVNKQAIKEALQKGEKLDFAHLEATEGVRFR